MTDARNAGRRNLRCPFGCRQRHRRQCSCQRSTAYYQTAAGKRKKQGHNRRRCRRFSAESPAVPESPPQPTAQAPDALAAAQSDQAQLQLGGVVLDDSSLTNTAVLPYLRMMVSLIEGVPFAVEELLALLRQGLRQHSIASRRRTDYVLCFLRQHPP